MDIKQNREAYRDFLKRAAKAQDAEAPLHMLDVASADGGMEPLNQLQTFGMITVDDESDEITVTIEGRLFAGVLAKNADDFGPGKLAEMRGSISETELAARYIESKVRGIEKHMKTDANRRDTLQWLGLILKNTADEFRQQMHIPSVIIDGEVKSYDSDNETGIEHAANLRMFFSDVGERNVRAGWWSDLETGDHKKRNVGELLILFVTEIVEAYDAWLENADDDKLPEYPGFGVEMADLGIRWADLCGAALRGDLVAPSGDLHANPGESMFQSIRKIAHDYEAIRKTPAAEGPAETGDFLPPMDIAAMTDAKLHFNANRPDHKIEARLADDGKRT